MRASNTWPSSNPGCSNPHLCPCFLISAETWLPLAPEITNRFILEQCVAQSVHVQYTVEYIYINIHGWHLADALIQSELQLSQFFGTHRSPTSKPLSYHFPRKKSTILPRTLSDSILDNRTVSILACGQSQKLTGTLHFHFTCTTIHFHE